MVIEKNPNWIDVKKMSNNKNFKKYEQLISAQEAIKEQQEKLREDAETLIEERVDRLKELTRIVAEKCLSGYHPYANIDHAFYGKTTRKEILGEYSWYLSGKLKVKSMNSRNFTLAEMKYNYSKSSYEEVGEITLSRSLLHISEREFNSLVRAQIRNWKIARHKFLEESNDKKKKLLESKKAELKRTKASLDKLEEEIKGLESN